MQRNMICRKLVEIKFLRTRMKFVIFDFLRRSMEIQDELR